MWRARGVSVVLFWAVALYAPLAAAQSIHGSELTFGQIDAECFDRERLVALVIETLGPNPIQRSAPLRLEISIARTGTDSIRATMRAQQVDGSTASRVTDAVQSECVELTHTVAFQVAVAIDPMVALRSNVELAPTLPTGPGTAQRDGQRDAPAWQEEAAHEQEAQDAHDSRPLPDSAQQPSRSESLRFHAVGVGGGAIVGAVPGVAPLAEVRAELRYEAWKPVAAVHASLPSHEDFRSGDVAVTFAGVELGICRVFGRGELCLGVDVAAVWGAGQGYRTPSTELVPLLVPVLGYAQRFPIAAGLWLVPRIAIGVVLWSATFEVDNVAAFRTAPLLATLSVDIMLGGR